MNLSSWTYSEMLCIFLLLWVSICFSVLYGIYFFTWDFLDIRRFQQCSQIVLQKIQRPRKFPFGCQTPTYEYNTIFRENIQMFDSSFTSFIRRSNIIICCNSRISILKNPPNIFLSCGDWKIQKLKRFWLWVIFWSLNEHFPKRGRFNTLELMRGWIMLHLKVLGSLFMMPSSFFNVKGLKRPFSECLRIYLKMYFPNNIIRCVLRNFSNY